MAHHPLTRPVFKLMVLGLAILSGMVECAALLRARLGGHITGLRRV